MPRAALLRSQLLRSPLLHSSLLRLTPCHAAAQAAEEACDQLRRALGASKQREATLRQKLSTLRANSLEARVQRLRRRIKVPEAEEAEEVPLTGATALSSAPRSKRRQSEASLMSAQQGASESTARRKQRSLASGSVTSASQPVGTRASAPPLPSYAPPRNFA